MNTIKTLAILIVAGLAIYIWRVPLYTVAMQSSAVLLPCKQTITYRLGNIDPGFRLSTSTALSAMNEAAQLWNDGQSRSLLVYDPDDGAVVISFEYDKRQEITQQLQELSGSVSEDRAAYEALKAQYSSLYADYISKRSAFNTANESLRKQATEYQAQVDSWNARGGAPKKVYDQLQADKARITQLQDQLRRSQETINAQVTRVNSMVAQLNDMARSLNLNVEKYNTVGSVASDEFEQGVYESGLGWRRITIFEYENRIKLVRVLSHEMGHAIGLDHVGDVNAIMAAVNEGEQIALTKGDVMELGRVCSQNPLSILKERLVSYVSGTYAE